jgi:hypothetical protein
MLDRFRARVSARTERDRLPFGLGEWLCGVAQLLLKPERELPFWLQPVDRQDEGRC